MKIVVTEEHIKRSKALLSRPIIPTPLWGKCCPIACAIADNLGLAHLTETDLWIYGPNVEILRGGKKLTLPIEEAILAFAFIEAFDTHDLDGARLMLPLSLEVRLIN